VHADYADYADFFIYNYPYIEIRLSQSIRLS